MADTPQFSPEAAYMRFGNLPDTLSGRVAGEAMGPRLEKERAVRMRKERKDDDPRATTREMRNLPPVDRVKLDKSLDDKFGVERGPDGKKTRTEPGAATRYTEAK